MFGFSVTKLLVLAGVILAVWYGFKLVGRLDSARKAEAKLRRQADGGRKTKPQGPRDAAARPAPPRQAADPDAEEMLPCPACRAYVAAASAKNCGRADCPY
ncbi:hypothetical protein [Algihabitans albus]|uniref:hypothetical protein n=1 Tax=Algihabitans albus TaxID=2164067 RepID=UPI000E5CEE35|nr:hypothetical protein [Algihabitans albus]